MMSESIGPAYTFIMGRGHSGSTVLDSLLGNAAGCVSVGGIVAGIQRPDALCSCGEPVSGCRFWVGVREHFEASTGINWADAAKELKAQWKLSMFVPTLFTRASAPWVRRRLRVIEGIADAVRQTTGHPIVVDSSKAIPVGLFIARFVPNPRIIHLVRNPEAVLGSNLHRIREGTGLYLLRRSWKNQALTPLFIILGALAWLAANLLAEVAGRVAGGSRVVRIRFEDLCADTPAVLARLGSFVGTDASGVVDAVARKRPLPAGHKSAGNRMRLGGDFVWDPSRASGRPLPRAYRWTVRAITWPLMAAYGYLSPR